MSAALAFDNAAFSYGGPAVTYWRDGRSGTG